VIEQKPETVAISIAVKPVEHRDAAERPRRESREREVVAERVGDERGEHRAG